MVSKHVPSRNGFGNDISAKLQGSSAISFAREGASPHLAINRAERDEQWGRPPRCRNYKDEGYFIVCARRVTFPTSTTYKGEGASA